MSVTIAGTVALDNVKTTKDRIFAIIGHDLRKPALAFRGITWAARQPEARLDELAPIGARLSDAP